MALTTSAQWHEAIKAQFRFPAYLKLTWRLVPPGIKEDMVVTSTSSDSHSNPTTLQDRKRVGVLPKKYATLELNRWKLDGTWNTFPASNTPTDDFWTIPVTNESVSILFTFDKPYNIPGLWIDWDQISGSWPTEMVVHGFNYAGVETYTTQVISIEEPTGFTQLPMDAIKSLSLEIVQWSKPNWRARINEITFGLNLQYDSTNQGRIRSATQTRVADPLSESLPTNTVSMTIRNEDRDLDPTLKTGNSPYLAARQRVQLEWGFEVTPGEVEWLEPQNYYLNTFSVPADKPDVVLDMTDRLYFLTDDFIKDVYTGAPRSFKAIATAILESSDVIREYQEEKPWRFADKLTQWTTTAPMPRRAVNSLLQLIASATGTWLRSNPVDGYVQIDDIDLEQSVHEIGVYQELGDPGITLQQPLKSITIAVYRYNRASSATEIASGDYYINGTQQLEISYNVNAAAEVSATVTNGTLVSAEYFSSTAILTVSAASTTVNVVLTGKEIKQHASYAKTFENKDVAQGVNVTLENPLVTEFAYIAQLTEWLKQWYQKRQVYNMPYTGYPELVAGDEISLTTVYGAQPATVTKNKIDFSGGWSGVAEVI